MIGIGALLSGPALYDIDANWAVEEKSIWSTLLVNALPLSLAFSVPGTGWYLADRSSEQLYLSKAVMWTLLTSIATLALGGLMIGLQLSQGEIKPGVVLLQLTALGAAAGLFIGYSAAETESARWETEKRELRLQATFDQTFQFTGLLETDGTLIEAYGTALKVGGLARDDVLGRPFWET